MAYMNQVTKQQIVAAAKPVLDAYRMKGSFSVRNSSTLCLTLRQGPIDFIGDIVQENDQLAVGRAQVDLRAWRTSYSFTINEYWYHENFTGRALEFLSALLPTLKSANWYDRSDIMTDYFDCSYYINVRVGTYDRPYIVTR